MIPPARGRTPEDMEALNQAFQAFNEATAKLQDSYDSLKERVKQLDLELARKNQELFENLREKEEVKNYLSNILESLTSGVLVVDNQGFITTCNRTAGLITGQAPADCLNKPLRKVFTHDLFEILVQRVTESGRSISLDRELPGENAKPLFLRIFASRVFDQNQQPIGTVLILQDNTRLHTLEDEAQRNQRLRAMGEMAAGIAHEIRNPLASIELFASLLKKDLAGDPGTAPLVDHIRAGVKNMDRIISSFLLFAKSPRPSRQKCDVRQLLTDLLEASPDLELPENIRVVRQFAPGECWVSGDGELLRRVFHNLLRNGLQAMPEGGELGVSIEPAGTDDEGWNVDHRRFVTLSISDTGGGIAAEHLEKIFDPFFSTKDKGTGLGLAICHNIIKAHQGTIDVESAIGEKTTFIVRIPGWDDELD